MQTFELQIKISRTMLYRTRAANQEEAEREAREFAKRYQASLDARGFERLALCDERGSPGRAF